MRRVGVSLVRRLFLTHHHHHQEEEKSRREELSQVLIVRACSPTQISQGGQSPLTWEVS